MRHRVDKEASPFRLMTSAVTLLLVGCSHPAAKPESQESTASCYALGDYKIDRKMQITFYGEVGVKGTLADCPVQDVGIQFLGPHDKAAFDKVTDRRNSPAGTITKYDVVFNGYVVRDGGELSVVVSTLRHIKLISSSPS